MGMRQVGSLLVASLVCASGANAGASTADDEVVSLAWHTYPGKLFDTSILESGDELRIPGEVGTWVAAAHRNRRGRFVIRVKLEPADDYVGPWTRGKRYRVGHGEVAGNVYWSVDDPVGRGFGFFACVDLADAECRDRAAFNQDLHRRIFEIDEPLPEATTTVLTGQDYWHWFLTTLVADLVDQLR